MGRGAGRRRVPHPGLSRRCAGVSLGVDTYEKDPISFFRLTSDDFFRYGETLGGVGLPTLFCMEGGYGVPEIGLNAANVLRGFEQVAV